MAAAAKKLGFTKVATLFGNDTSAQGSAPSAIAGVKRLHLNLVASQTLAIGQPSYRSEAQQLGSANPQAIITEADPQTSATYFAELSQLGHIPGADHRPGLAGAHLAEGCQRRDRQLPARQAGLRGRRVLSADHPAYRTYTGALTPPASRCPSRASGTPTSTRSRTTTRS